jgi:hypothetical protein
MDNALSLIHHFVSLNSYQQKFICYLLFLHQWPNSNGMMLHVTGMDNADSVEGFMAEKAGVFRHNTSSSSSSTGGGSRGSSSSSRDSSSEPDLLSGLPYRMSSSMSASKEQMLVQVGVLKVLLVFVLVDIQEGGQQKAACHQLMHTQSVCMPPFLCFV